MSENNLIILANANLYYGNEASVSRMNNYAKAVIRNNDTKVFFISTRNFKLNEELIQCEQGIFTSVEKEQNSAQKKIKRVISNFIFAYRISQWRKKLGGNTVFLIYPSTQTSFEFFLMFFLKILTSNRVYYEINEIRRTYDPINLKSISQLFRGLFNQLKYKIAEMCWPFYDGLICISSNIESYVKRYNKRTILVPILSDFDNTNFVFTPSNKRFEILFTGSVKIEKENLIEFLYALVKLDKIYKDWNLVLCGPLYSDDQVKLSIFINSHNLASKIICTGELPRKEVIQMQKKASLLILPRKNTKQNYYGFSTKLSEYALSGTPILMTNTGVVSDFFKDNYNCYMVEGYQRDDFFEKLKIAISSTPSASERLAHNAYNTAKEHFAYKNYTSLFTDFFNLSNRDTSPETGTKG